METLTGRHRYIRDHSPQPKHRRFRDRHGPDTLQRAQTALRVLSSRGQVARSGHMDSKRPCANLAMLKGNIYIYI